MEKNLTSAPAAVNVKAIKEWLITQGAAGIMKLDAICDILGISKRVIQDAVRNGEIHPLEKSTFSLDEVANFLMVKPRYMAQKKTKFTLTEEIYPEIQNILKQKYPTLIKLWNDDMEELVSIIAHRLANTPIGNKPCSNWLRITRVINKFWHSKEVQKRKVTVSIEDVGECNV
jgi:hypothetical protein